MNLIIILEVNAYRKEDFKHVRLPRLASKTLLEDLTQMQPFSSVEQTWIRMAEIRIRKCRDQLLFSEKLFPEACLFDGTIKKLSGKLNKTDNEISLSAILTFRNNAEFTSLALTASVLALSYTSYTSEVIMVDDSSNERMAIIQRVKPRLSHTFDIEIRSLRTHAGPLGYGSAMNLGLTRARGNYILLLNNDIIISKNTFKMLLATLKSHARVGGVVPRFVEADGKVQEAGSAIFTDGIAMQLGSALGLAYDDSLFRYVRGTDYGSAACLLIRKNLIMNGFDQIYQPAYYEDTDLSMMVRRLGYQMIYQPFSVVLHIGSMTYNNATLKRRLMLRNQNRFVLKWSHSLECFYTRWMTNWISLPSRHRILQLASRLSIFRVLFLDRSVPCYDHDSRSVRTINIIRVLVSLGAHVTFVARNVDYNSACVYQLNWLGCHVIKQNQLDLGWANDVKPPCVYDIIVVAHKTSFNLWQNLLEIACFEIPLIFDTVGLHFLHELRKMMTIEGIKYQNEMKFSQNIFRYKKHFRLSSHQQNESISVYRSWLRNLSNEVTFMNKSAAIIVISPDEFEIIEELKAMGQLRPTLPVSLVPSIYDEEKFMNLHINASDFQKREGILFVVGNWALTSYLDAVSFLVKEILPKLANSARIPPELTLYIVGNGEAPRWIYDINKVGDISVVIHDSVKYLNTILQHVRIAVAPLRHDTGDKDKIHSAMLHGVPVIATSMAIEGMFLTHNKDVIVADGVLDFASRLLDLYVNDDLWIKIRRNALIQIKMRFSASTAKHVLKKLIDFLCSTNPRLKNILSDGRRALQGKGGCDEMRGKYGIRAVVPDYRVLNMSYSLNDQFEKARTLSRNFVFHPISNFLDRVWGIDSADNAAKRCRIDKACTGWCWHPVESTFFYHDAIRHDMLINLSDYAQDWECWLHHDRIKRSILYTVQDDGYSDIIFNIITNVSHQIPTPNYTTKLEWRLPTSDDAQRLCVLEYDCEIFCHNPGGWTFFYDGLPSEMSFIDRRDAVYNSLGWTCFQRQNVNNFLRHKVAKPVFVQIERPSNLIFREKHYKTVW
eukprot:CAMPEP_0197308842 /NCGR_PEP_ID=MMETSP0891-20130614/7376_1 /TAXON_ID=44058 ORGANISM="Aureoumbra lagunensis, Strain CCMP1510" /NCGR_SAMPLE_ID=MMETSP0891 /ASSEMBLY_ACC=CAM_ASM_000534 /LENGTH=1058 /DNA_ID=CAMNT_0042793585 /DNA_START=128 /DNA_END=3301 /DNA_ORIENTATION=-